VVSRKRKQLIKPDSPLNKFSIDLSKLNTKPKAKRKKPPKESSRGGKKRVLEEALNEHPCFRTREISVTAGELDHRDGYY